MLRFGEFLEDIRVSFVVGLTVFLSVCVIASSWAFFARVGISQKIKLYKIFQHDRNPKIASLEEGEFLEIVHAMFDANVALAKRDAALALIKKDFAYTDIFLALPHEERMICLFRKKEIPDLIASEEAAYAKMTWSWSPVLRSAFIAWQIISVILLYYKWWKESYSMQFFPYTHWWFYGYLLLAFPYSLAIVFLLVLYALRWNSGSSVGKRQIIRVEREYAEQYNAVRDAKDKERKSWCDLFPAIYTKKRLLALQGEKHVCAENILVFSKQLTEEQTRHYALRAEEESLTSEQKEFAERIVLPQEQWLSEFEEIYNHPMVNAVSVDVANAQVIVFTKRFQTISGGAGPFRININFETKQFNAYKAYRGALHSSTGLTRAEGGSFCFGNARTNIQSLINEYKISDALKMMFFSLGTDARY